MRVSLAAAQAQSLAAFYVEALGFRRLDDGLLGFGDSTLELRDCPHGRLMPAGAANDAIFQHFAMIVNDIDAACERLNAAGGFTAISTDGPVKLPASSGGVTAFKFRDPEGHPLEFIQKPRAEAERIDHTAIVVADTAASVAFYARYGLAPQGGSLNSGPEQAALDGLDDPVVTVTRLAGKGAALALELLCYHQPKGAPAMANKGDQDAWATRLVFRAPTARLLRDPDGHDVMEEV
jgi:catechol 2,3-dioxygenase-like lactoylglutathione lyase family enzyme